MDAMRYFERLMARDLRVVIDDARWAELLTSHSLPFTHFDEYDFADPDQDPFFLLITHLDYHRKLMDQWKDARFVSSHLALAKFDTSPSCVEYSLSQFLSVDFAGTLAKRASYYEAMIACQEVHVVTEAGVLRCRFGDEIEVANDDVELKAGWLYSVAEFFESSIINLEADRSSFTLDGDLGFTGLIHLYNNADLRKEAGPLVDELVRLSTSGGPNVITFEGNQAVRLVVGGQDRTAVLRELLVGKEREGSSTEFAIGCVDFPAGPNWTQNSVMNEGCHGVHAGIGMGREIPHIDFICKLPELRFIPPETA